ncbi:uncharacterized protein G2W53_001104 [Senna tora]|uniref:Uncharacterized protein n=1 Tax=Senna tora TaxID=362788 RepID=A0A835CJ45_9FABA|nr:uncharacterized protein G2W53_001104 [Senna tora]
MPEDITREIPQSPSQPLDLGSAKESPLRRQSSEASHAPCISSLCCYYSQFSWEQCYLGVCMEFF